MHALAEARNILLRDKYFAGWPGRLARPGGGAARGRGSCKAERSGPDQTSGLSSLRDPDEQVVRATP